MTAVLGRKGQGSRKISGHTTANSCDIQPKLLADNTVEFACLLQNNFELSSCSNRRFKRKNERFFYSTLIWKKKKSNLNISTLKFYVVILIQKPKEQISTYNIGERFCLDSTMKHRQNVNIAKWVWRRKKRVMQTIDDVKNDNTGVNIEGITMLM